MRAKVEDLRAKRQEKLRAQAHEVYERWVPPLTAPVAEGADRKKALWPICMEPEIEPLYSVLDICMTFNLNRSTLYGWLEDGFVSAAIQDGDKIMSGIFTEFDVVAVAIFKWLVGTRGFNHNAAAWYIKAWYNICRRTAMNIDVLLFRDVGQGTMMFHQDEAGSINIDVDAKASVIVLQDNPSKQYDRVVDGIADLGWDSIFIINIAKLRAEVREALDKRLP